MRSLILLVALTGVAIGHRGGGGYKHHKHPHGYNIDKPENNDLGKEDNTESVNKGDIDQINDRLVAITATQELNRETMTTMQNKIDELARDEFGCEINVETPCWSYTGGNEPEGCYPIETGCPVLCGEWNLCGSDEGTGSGSGSDAAAMHFGEYCSECACDVAQCWNDIDKEDFCSESPWCPVSCGDGENACEVADADGNTYEICTTCSCGEQECGYAYSNNTFCISEEDECPMTCDPGTDSTYPFMCNDDCWACADGTDASVCSGCSCGEQECGYGDGAASASGAAQVYPFPEGSGSGSSGSW